LEETNWFTLGAINLLDYSITPKITASGLYMVPFAGISRVRVVSETPVGGFKVFAITTD
jgi:hypothetical protein